MKKVWVRVKNETNIKWSGNLLLFETFGFYGSLLCNECALSNIQIIKVTNTFICKIVILHRFVHVHLVVERVHQFLLLGLLVENLLHYKIICFLRTKVGFVELFVE